MNVTNLDEAQIERDLKTLSAIRDIAWQRSPETLLGLIDRIRVKLIVDDIPRRQRRVYRTIIDYFEDVLDERFDKETHTRREPARRTARAYVRDFLKSLED